MITIDIIVIKAKRKNIYYINIVYNKSSNESNNELDVNFLLKVFNRLNHSIYLMTDFFYQHYVKFFISKEI